jgi:hypothetical protein
MGFESGNDEIFCVGLVEMPVEMLVEMLVESFAVLRWNLSTILLGRR